MNPKFLDREQLDVPSGMLLFDWIVCMGGGGDWVAFS